MLPGYGCVPHERVCDHHNDCGDWQDEPGSCHQAGHHCDAGDNGGCDQVTDDHDDDTDDNDNNDQVCLNTTSGHRCSCDGGYELVTNTTCQGESCDGDVSDINFVVSDIDECKLTPHLCSHVCHNTEGSHQCACYQGYSVDPSNSSLCQVIINKSTKLIKNDFSGQ